MNFKNLLLVLFASLVLYSCDSKKVTYYEENGRKIASYVEDEDEKGINLLDEPFEEEKIMQILDYFELGKEYSSEDIPIVKYDGDWETGNFMIKDKLWEFSPSIEVEDPSKYKNLKYCCLTRLEAKRTAKMLKADAKESIEGLRDFLNDYNDFVAGMNKEVDPVEIPSYAESFESHTSIPEELKGTEYESEARRLVKQINSKSSSFYSKCRSIYVKLAKKALWRQDIDVSQSGTTIHFVGGLFVSHANIEDTFMGIKEYLQTLKFKKATFQWTSGANGTYYLLD